MSHEYRFLVLIMVDLHRARAGMTVFPVFFVQKNHDVTCFWMTSSFLFFAPNNGHPVKDGFALEKSI
jgi:hypothetical protein